MNQEALNAVIFVLMGAAAGAWVSFVHTKRATAWAIREAYAAGRAAHAADSCVTMNPYHGHLEWAWYRGWMAAAMELDTRRLLDALRSTK